MADSLGRVDRYKGQTRGPQVSPARGFGPFCHQAAAPLSSVALADSQPGPSPELSGRPDAGWTDWLPSGGAASHGSVGTAFSTQF